MIYDLEDLILKNRNKEIHMNLMYFLGIKNTIATKKFIFIYFWS